MIGALGPAVAIVAAVLQRNGFAEFIRRPFEERLSALLRRRQFTVWLPPAIRSGRQASNVESQIGELEVIVVLRPPEVLFRTRAALGGDVRVSPIPLVRLRPSQVLEHLIVHNVSTETVWLQIPLQPVEC